MKGPKKQIKDCELQGIAYRRAIARAFLLWSRADIGGTETAPGPSEPARADDRKKV